MIKFANNTSEPIKYITSPAGLAAIQISHSIGGRKWYWFLTDHTTAPAVCLKHSARLCAGLESITALVRNNDGQKVEMSYDACLVKPAFCEGNDAKSLVEQIPSGEDMREGNRRDPNTWDNYNGTLPSFITDRGYTGHSLSREERNGKHLDIFCLINPDTLHFIALSGLAASDFSSHFIHEKHESAN